MKHYWFKPKQFWKWFAAYYPVSWQGWLATIILAALFFYSIVLSDQGSHSVSDTLINASPWMIIVLLAFDLITVRTGEYPSWWKRRGNK